MNRDRRLSYLILKDVQQKSGWSNLTTNSYLRKEGAASPAFVRELVYGVLRNEKLLDYNIDSFLKKPKLGVSERIWLRMGFYQLVFMDGVAEYAAINETVALAAAFKKGSQGFINAVLRSFQRSGSKLKYPDPKNVIEYLSVRYSCDESIAKLWLSEYGLEKAEQLLRSSCEHAVMCIRTNLLKISRDDLSDRLRNQGYTVRESKLTSTGLYVEGSDLLDTKEYAEALFSVQGDSSQYAVEILDPKSGSLVLDLCAAPGGKSCAMAERMRNEGRIEAFDIHEHRVQLIKNEAKRLGLGIISARQADAAQLSHEYDGKADYVLADVPCSGLGTLRENPEIKLRTLDYSQLSDIQSAILKNAARCVKAGGRLMYSTCTIDPHENTNIVNRFLEENSSFEIEREIQMFTEPDSEDGFYICLLRRL